MESIKELEKKCGAKYGVSWADDLRMKLSIHFTRIILYTHLTPNQLTTLGLILGILSSVFFARGEYFYSLIGILFLNISVFLDWIDGSVARYKKMCSLRGYYLDILAYEIVTPLIIIGLSIGAYFNNLFGIPGLVYLITGLFAAFSIMINSGVKYSKYRLYIKSKDFPGLERYIKEDIEHTREGKKGFKNKTKEFIKEFFRVCRSFNAIFFFGVFNLLPILVLIYGILFSFNTFKNIINEITIITN